MIILHFEDLCSIRSNPHGN